MDFKDVKCPNCGGIIRFGSNDKKVCCEYCDSSFIVDSLEDNAYKEEKGKLRAQQEILEKNMGNMGINFKKMKIFKILFGIFFVLIFFSILIVMFFHFKVNKMSDSIDTFSDVEINSFNGKYEIYGGKTWWAGLVLDSIIMNNSKDNSRILFVSFGDIYTSDIEKIKEIRNSLENKYYYIKYNYDEVGFIKEMIIEDVY